MFDGDCGVGSSGRSSTALVAARGAVRKDLAIDGVEVHGAEPAADSRRSGPNPEEELELGRRRARSALSDGARVLYAAESSQWPKKRPWSAWGFARASTS